MKISELIQELEEFKKEYGDLSMITERDPERSSIMEIAEFELGPCLRHKDFWFVQYYLNKENKDDIINAENKDRVYLYFGCC